MLLGVLLLGCFIGSVDGTERQLSAAPPSASSCSGGMVYAEHCGPGFSATDSTTALQAAFDSGAHTVWVRNVSGLPWIIRPVFLRSNQTVRFGSNTLVLAKRGEFHAKNDALLNIGCPDDDHGHLCQHRIINVTLQGEPGTTLRMWRSDYSNSSLYTKAEWRHGLNIAGGSSGIHIEGLRIELTGGDGICIGDGQNPSVDVVVQNVTCDQNYRQGMSVVNVRGLVVSDSTFSRTVGTDPQSGVDIEPDLDSFYESNITFRRCNFLKNLGSAFKISAGRLLNFSYPFTLLVEECTFVGGSTGSAGITMSFSGVRGSVVFRNSIIGPTAGPGLLLEDHTVGSAVAVFDRMKLRGTNFGPFVKSMAGWPANCSAPICVHCGAPSCLETAPDDYSAITDRTPGGLVFTEIEIDPACDSTGKGSWHCLPEHGNGQEAFAVVSTAAAAQPRAPIASGTIIVHATDKTACSVDRDTPAAFRDVVVDCRLATADAI